MEIKITREDEAPLTFKKGDLFKGRGGGDVYLLADLGAQEYVLINTRTGHFKYEAFKAVDGQCITLEEMQNASLYDLVLLNNSKLTVESK